MKKLYAYVVAVIFSITSSTAVLADSGFSVGLVGQFATFKTDGSETETTGDKEENHGEVTESAALPSLFAEYSAIHSSGLGITVGAEYVPGEAEIGSKSRLDEDGSDPAENDDGTYTAKAEVSNYASIYIEPTFMFSESWGLYGKVGAARITVNSLENIGVGANSSTYADEDINGGMYGIGFRGQHSSGAFVKVEGLVTKFEGFTLTSTTGNKNTIQARPESRAIRLAVGYQF